MSHAFERCTRCVLSSAFPKIKFNAEGVCNYCEKKTSATPTDTIIEQAREKIASLFDQREHLSDYDAIVCYSGGKDSTYTLKLAVEKYKLRVLSFTLDNGYISKTALENIARVVDSLGVDHWTFKPGSGRYDAIARASAVEAIYKPITLTRISSICNSCISIVNTTALKLAIEKNIPFIIAGFTLGQIPINSIIYKNNHKFLEDSKVESLAKLRNAAGDFVDQYLTLPNKMLNDIERYPHNVNILCVENITEEQIKEEIKSLGWESPGDVDGCSSNCMLNTFNNHVHEHVFGYNPYEMELSHLIREGLLLREEALQKMSTRPEKTIAPVMKKLNISEQDLDRVKWVYQGKQ